jgi:hypothetical protein
LSSASDTAIFAELVPPLSTASNAPAVPGFDISFEKPNTLPSSPIALLFNPNRRNFAVADAIPPA